MPIFGPKWTYLIHPPNSEASRCAGYFPVNVHIDTEIQWKPTISGSFYKNISLFSTNMFVRPCFSSFFPMFPTSSQLPGLSPEAWSVPFLIRARQCVITARHAPDALSRDLQRINLAKYCSALPVVFFAMCGPGEKLDNIDNIMGIINYYQYGDIIHYW